MNLLIHRCGVAELQIADHRMVLAFALAGMQVEGETLISDAQMAEKSFEKFIPDMRTIGANLELVKELC